MLLLCVFDHILRVLFIIFAPLGFFLLLLLFFTIIIILLLVPAASLV